MPDAVQAFTDALSRHVGVHHGVEESAVLLVDLDTFAAEGLDPPLGTIESSSFACVLALVERGDYVTLLPEQLLADHSVRRGVSQVTMQTPMPSWNVAVIYRAQHDLSGVCQAFLDELRSVAREIVAGGNARR